MTTKQIVLSLIAAAVAFLVVALACHGAGANARGFVLLPLAAAAAAGLYVARPLLACWILKLLLKDK